MGLGFLIVVGFGFACFLYIENVGSNSFNIKKVNPLKETNRFLPDCFSDAYLGMTFQEFQSKYPDASFGPYSGTIAKCTGSIDSIHAVFNFNTDVLVQDGESKPKPTAQLTKVQISALFMVLDDFSFFPDSTKLYASSDFDSIPYHGLAIYRARDAIILIRPIESRYGDRSIDYTVHYPIGDEFRINYLHKSDYREANQEQADLIKKMVIAQIGNKRENLIPYHIVPCFQAIDEIEIPDDKHKIGVDVLDGNCVAKFWFNDTIGITNYKEKRRRAGLKETIERNKEKNIDIKIEYGIIQLPVGF